MATQVLMPKLGFEMNDGSVEEWFVPDGGQVTAGQLLLSIGSDKSINEIESPASGVLRIIVQKGETRGVGTVLALIE